jgi:O2-independent ubiquinone biosynthesis accessory factor UbiT
MILPAKLPTQLVGPLKLPLRMIPGRVHAELFTRMFNHVMRGQSFTQRLPALDGKVVRIDIHDAPAHVDFVIQGSRIIPATGQTPDVTIRGGIEDFWQLAARAEDPDTLFFNRRLSIEGDTETGLHVKNLLDALDYDLEAHVRAVLGESLGGLALSVLHRLPLPGRPARPHAV